MVETPAQDPVLYAIKQEVPKRALGSNEQPDSARKSLVQAFRTAGKKLRYLFRARKYFSPFNLLTLYKAQIRPSLEYCSHIWGAAAPTTLSILDAVLRRAIRLIGSSIKEKDSTRLSPRKIVFEFCNITYGQSIMSLINLSREERDAKPGLCRYQ
nr:unnamed protein product [Callosobruchus chinensis]